MVKKILTEKFFTRSLLIALMMEAVSITETSVYFYETTRRNIPCNLSRGYSTSATGTPPRICGSQTPPVCTPSTPPPLDKSTHSVTQRFTSSTHQLNLIRLAQPKRKLNIRPTFIIKHWEIWVLFLKVRCSNPGWANSSSYWTFPWFSSVRPCEYLQGTSAFR
jgi:hypothetical protein